MNPSGKKYWGVAIPGLTMAASEIPETEGLYVLENPSVGSSKVSLPLGYSLESVARYHLKSLQSLVAEGKLQSPFTIIGMSMGGMILSILGSKYRSELPAGVRFRFLVTTPNSSKAPVAPLSHLLTWRGVRPGKWQTYRPVIEPFFSPGFIAKHPEKVEAYVKYIGTRQNNQSLFAFFQQLFALRRADCSHYFSKLNPKECVFIGGAQDRVLGPAHNQALKELLPEAQHIELAGVGHMIHLEAPRYFLEKL